MRLSFPSLRFGFMVGIAGGAPTDKNDIRLGDIVVSSPTPKHGGVIQYDFGKAIQDHEFEETGYLAPPPEILLNALSKIRVQHKRWGHKIPETIGEWLKKKNNRLKADYEKPDIKLDKLHRVSYTHVEEGICDCQIRNRETIEEELGTITINRGGRDSQDSLHVHYGLVASANTLMKDARARDAIARKHNVLCFDMEAAGLMNNFLCLVIRGICDYSDSHKNDEWQGYAAATAAVYAKDLLEIIPSRDIESIESVGKQLSTAMPLQNKFCSKMLQDAIMQADAGIRDYYKSTDRLRIERLSGETISLEHCYINLILKDQSDEKLEEDDKESFSLKQRLWLERHDTEKSMALHDLFNQKNLPDGKIVVPRRIFIQGRAGVGKTTLCKKIVYEFLQQRLGHNLFDRLIWLPLRSLEHKGAKYEWLELLQDVFTPAPQISDWDKLVVMLSKQLLLRDFRHRTLFLLDGLDEFSRQSKRDDKVSKFLETIICDMPNIIITSRPQANSLKIGRFDCQLETIGFARNQIDTYIEHCVADQHTRSCMKELIMTKPILQGLLRIPVQMDAFCCTWNSEGSHEQESLTPSSKNSFHTAKEETLSTMTTLYSSISIELCRKDLMRIGRYDDPHALRTNDVLALFAEELSFIEELAFQGLINDIVEFHPRHQESIDIHFRQSGNTLSLSYGSVIEQLSFLRTSGLQLHHRKRIYHFLHLTFQEFFAAKHYVRHWQTNTDLICLNLDLAVATRNVRSPSKFLQTEKYNPQYNIFWRFVAGLVQMQQEQVTAIYPISKTILEFFDEFDSKSRDLLGSAHRRQLMYFLSELLPSTRADIINLRASVEDLLRQGTIMEYKRAGRLRLCREIEFPENVLCSFLKDQSHIPYTDILSILKARPLLNLKTLHCIFNLTTNAFATDLRLQAIGILFQNSRAESQEIVAQAAQRFCVILEDIDPSIRVQAVRSLKGNSSLPQSVLIGLTTALKDKDQEVRYLATITLKAMGGLPKTAVTALIAIFLDSDDSVNHSAINVLKEQLHLPQNAFAILNAAQKHNGLTMRFLVAYALKDQTISTYGIIEHWSKIFDKEKILDEVTSLGRETISILINGLNSANVIFKSPAARILGEQTFLPENALTALITAFKNEGKRENSFVRRCAIRAFGRRPSLPEEAISALLAALKDKDLRSSAAHALRQQSSLSEIATEALTVALKDEDSWVRYYAAYIMENHSSLPQENIAALIISLDDEYEEVRLCSMKALGRQSSLTKEAIAALIRVMITAFKNQKFEVRSCALKIFSKQSALPQESIATLITALIMTLGDEDKDVRCDAATALGELSALPREAITALMTSLKDKDSWVRYKAAKALGRQPSLPQEIITILIASFKDEDDNIRDSAADALAEHSLLPQESAAAVVADLIILLKNADSRVRSSAAKALRNLSHFPQDIIAALTTALKDEDSDVRLSAAESLNVWQSTWSDLSEEDKVPLMMAQMTAFETKDYRLREQGVFEFEDGSEILSPLPPEAVSALITALKDEDSRVRLSAAIALYRESRLPLSLPHETIVGLVAALKNTHDNESAYNILASQSSLPQEVILELVAALKDESQLVRCDAVVLLGEQCYLPPEAIMALIAACKDEDSTVQNRAADVVRAQSFLPVEAIMALIKILEDEGHWVFDVLSRHDHFFSVIKDLDDHLWYQLWSYWCKEDSHHEFCCYELEGSLYLWSNGKLQQISSDPARTEKLLQVVLGVNIQSSKAQAGVEVNSAAFLNGITQKVTETVLTSNWKLC